MLIIHTAIQITVMTFANEGSVKVSGIYGILPNLQHQKLTFDNCSPNSSNFWVSGVFSCSVSIIWFRILPISVLRPVATTIPRHLPDAILVPLNKRFFLSWLTAPISEMASVNLITDTDSPVRMDWSTRRLVLHISIIRISAGTLSPTK